MNFRERRLGTLVQTTSLDVVRALRLDWLFLDGEHGAYDVASARAARAAVSVPCLLRVPKLEDLHVAAACGVEGLILPHVHSAQIAAEAVRAIGGRARCVVQAESREALEDIDAIARTPGVDCVFVGPYDLTESLGIAEQFTHPIFRDAVEKIARTCRAAGMPLGIFRMTREELREHEAQGFTLLAAGVVSGK